MSEAVPIEKIRREWDAADSIEEMARLSEYIPYLAETADRLRAELAARDCHDREQRAAAAKAIADKWQTGAWADVLQPYYARMPTVEVRLGIAQAVTEWLRDRIEASHE